MEVESIPFKKTGYFSNLICDYLDGKETLFPFYDRPPQIEQFAGQIKTKQNFPITHREVLYSVLKNQYRAIDISEDTKVNISLLKEASTFTVVTGHQLNLFTGPLYFLYKIITTINLTKELKLANPENNFVPIYWMATEDHDFEEINYFNFKGKKLQWNKTVTGAVGPMTTDGLEPILEALSNEMGQSINATKLKELFGKAYMGHDNLSDATRFLANELFGEHGLVILDGNHTELKGLLVPYVKRDLLENASYKKVMETIGQLQELPDNYGIQVNPREINYFYLLDGVRERIVERDGRFYVNDTKIEFSQEEILNELETYPERFSPNVITRPLYQEVVLPNLCYIGGGGELAYWLQLKAMFTELKVPFPILLLRNSALVITGKQKEKLERMNISMTDIFLNQSSFINKKIREISNIDIDFAPQKKYLQEQFKDLYDLAVQTDASFLGAVKAQEVKQLKGLDNLQGRLLKAQKRKLQDHVVRMTEIQNQLFPNKSLQERHLNFSELYLEYGERLIPHLMKALRPLSGAFSIVKMD
ncbi:MULTISPECIES: bacillithiol biosynthesis cysteine-adding enzyme BshC [unclassified Arenibacter]|uniref:bacillithiol biosynthesis cysteine-adding enzyme BshC n=1 Tax=unclassified Arenibacter TaxID=2615047 RepID=UPI000E3519E1|nr:MULTISPECIES: bacillithiol biosynthesis cysteine-adding enzyme BshC [unclassified Arenibacter]MCM4165244.1 bacillithiol biosynthesis cysteine-adding enzyme BshC [Arenibacter sp. A80]RFT55098.1 bacillithiol biosynthesis cysteine-adding enzyme BshC [Arenibacter sp. P308M17]